ncbi:hypothetical protein FHU36_002445 [Nonomuraea muscovyensis]|uniref:Methylamine utilisation protein MauE domain-containing protein n=1 Tax=Nonomuraea muscovyensis TaxID=1124761 RepID=A0A7X0EYQ7_9ACTN|nr:MauE/DoxX family redox-associated membrane protein [Nonomuraea muscovyensis]MBB6345936.1 hypothetical protein [Nonomuraea muscovyensis]
MIVAESAHLAVAAVLLVAAPAKLRDVPGFAASVAGYRVLPGRLSLPVAVAALAAEVVSAGLLLVPGARQWGAAVAALLFTAFLVAMVAVLRRGMSVACGCFGGRDLVGPGTLARTGLLLALAVTAGLAGPVAFAPAQVPVAAVLLGLAFLTPRLFRRRRPSSGPRPGSRFALSGAPEPAGDRVLYALVSPGCGLCGAMLPEFAATAARMEVVLVSAVDGYGGAGLPVVVDPDVFDRNDIPWPPYAVVTGRDGTVLAGGGAAGPAELERVLARAERVAPT